ncbi:CoA-binding protein [Bordetella genomosp. 8]|uniref:CoA-binding protein n=1 Tax=Bordetella genomosp. 8 TaxID=1416806 RepID=A0A1W6YPF5_9BORD|nr:acetate--CoA ligase family protein [Bordetella genomosp. 8]ARP82965.1 CoA-binding protein [Bordetella genomosp. 8]
MNDNFEYLFAPNSVAIIGASDNPNKIGGRPIHFLRKYGFRGDVYPVNPGRQMVQGYRAYSDILDVPSVPDSVVIAVGTDAVADQVERCAQMGVRAAVLMSSGFGELGEKGRARERRLVEIANASGMRLMGPNCQGTANFSNGTILNFSTMFTDVAAQDGPIGIVSQSGAASVMPFALLRQAGLGVRYVIATGNDADLGACAMAEAVARDEDIKLILVYLEQISEPHRLASAARIAKERGAYIVVLKSGGSTKGASAAASHTGAVVGNEAAIDAFLARSGIWRARDIQDFILAAPLYLSDRPVGAGRSVAMSHSGAVAVMTADLAEREGLELADLADETKTRLTAILPDFGTAHNPLDTTAAVLSDPTMFPRVLSAIGLDSQADTVMVSVPMAGPGYDLETFADAAAEFVRTQNKPMVLSAPQPNVRAVFSARDIPVYATEADAIRALQQYTKHQQLRAALRESRVIEPIMGLPRGLQDEHRSLSLISDHGVPVVENILCNSPDEAVTAFHELGNVPVVVKGCAASIPHKSEHDLVYLHIRSTDDARRAAESCFAALKDMGITKPQVLVAKMVKGEHEIALGATVDAKLGPLVMIADGGTLVELRKDAVTLLAPFTAKQAREALARLRIAPLFQGYRGKPPLDVQALAEAAVALGDFAAGSRESLISVDINPVMVMPSGEGVLAVDAVVELNQ